jgi:hypothetical protein
MKYYLNALAAAAVAVSAASPVFANSQLIAAAGLTPAEAQGLSLTEIAQYKFNRETGRDGQQAAELDRVAPAVAASKPLNAVAISSANDGLSYSDQQRNVSRSGVTMASRNVGNGDWSQLIASAGLTPAEAKGMTLNEIAIAKFNHDADRDDRQGIVAE